MLAGSKDQNMSQFDSQSTVFPFPPQTECIVAFTLFSFALLPGHLISIKEAFNQALCKRTMLDTSQDIRRDSALKDLSVLIGRSSQ